MRKQVSISYSPAAIAAKQGDAIRAAARKASAAEMESRVSFVLLVAAVALAAAVLALVAF